MSPALAAKPGFSVLLIPGVGLLIVAGVVLAVLKWGL